MINTLNKPELTILKKGRHLITADNRKPLSRNYLNPNLILSFTFLPVW